MWAMQSIFDGWDRSIWLLVFNLQCWSMWGSPKISEEVQSLKNLMELNLLELQVSLRTMIKHFYSNTRFMLLVWTLTRDYCYSFATPSFILYWLYMYSSLICLNPGLVLIRELKPWVWLLKLQPQKVKTATQCDASFYQTNRAFHGRFTGSASAVAKWCVSSGIITGQQATHSEWERESLDQPLIVITDSSQGLSWSQSR